MRFALRKANAERAMAGSSFNAEASYGPMCSFTSSHRCGALRYREGPRSSGDEGKSDLYKHLLSFGHTSLPPQSDTSLQYALFKTPR